MHLFTQHSKTDKQREKLLILKFTSLGFLTEKKQFMSYRETTFGSLSPEVDS